MISIYVDNDFSRGRKIIKIKSMGMIFLFLSFVLRVRGVCKKNSVTPWIFVTVIKINGCCNSTDLRKKKTHCVTAVRVILCWFVPVVTAIYRYFLLNKETILTQTKETMTRSLRRKENDQYSIDRVGYNN